MSLGTVYAGKTINAETFSITNMGNLPTKF